MKIKHNKVVELIRVINTFKNVKNNDVLKMFRLASYVTHFNSKIMPEVQANEKDKQELQTTVFESYKAALTKYVTDNSLDFDLSLLEVANQENGIKVDAFIKTQPVFAEQLASLEVELNTKMSEINDREIQILPLKLEWITAGIEISVNDMMLLQDTILVEDNAKAESVV